MPKSFVVGDAGGSSTDWRVLRKGKIEHYKTAGFNAFTHKIETLIEEIKKVFDPKIFKLPIYFYAAGIHSESQKSVVEKALAEIFTSKIFVEHDMIGVARAVSGRLAGYVGILGTGANACYYDGKSVTSLSYSFGYVLGDEGSGAYLGKKLIQGVFRGNLDQKVVAKFEARYQLSADEVIQRIYDKPKPNHFLASFSDFIFSNRSNPDIYNLVKTSFEEYFDAFFGTIKNKNIPLNFAGSIAWHFSDILRDVAIEKGFILKTVVQSPIARLALYHQDGS